ncbi:MAG TPA: peroxiredoxin [Nitrososphaerales archaeon]|nr:peroxiredoxin [Nitrososphaerales archaeon]
MVPRLGQRAPDFALPDADGRLRRMSEFAENGATVLAFFPFAFSGVCDKEMCFFRDSYPELSSLSAQVLGISVDSVYSLKAFAQTYDFPFPLLSDFNKKVAKAYGVLQDPWVGHGYRGAAKRSVFVVDRRGVLRYRWVTDTPTDEPPYKEVMKATGKIVK